MASLTKAQTELIRSSLLQKGISHPDLEADLLDHVCSDVEARMAAGEPFEAAFEAAMGRFGERELQQVQQKTAALLDGRKVFYPGIRQTLGMLFLFFVLYFVGRFVVINPIAQLDRNFYQQYALLVESTLIGGCLLLVIAYARMELNERGFTRGTIFPFRAVPPGVFPAIIGILLVSGLWMEIATRWMPIPDALHRVIAFRLTHYTPLPVFVFSVLLFPFLTEILYRGIILRGLLRKHAPAKAILVSSLLYAVCWNPYFFGGTFLVGVFCGWLFYRTQSLLPAVAT
ncbi:MAG: CPBP family intramembrane metalloprotease, partial [Cytophagales bacterium]|nr:CPBP family intramembrane metalloprotease [Cytophagales bacterium]